MDHTELHCDQLLRVLHRSKQEVPSSDTEAWCRLVARTLWKSGRCSLAMAKWLLSSLRRVDCSASSHLMARLLSCSGSRPQPKCGPKSPNSSWPSKCTEGFLRAPRISCSSSCFVIRLRHRLQDLLMGYNLFQQCNIKVEALYISLPLSRRVMLGTLHLLCTALSDFLVVF